MGLYRRRAAICTVLSVLTPWKEISKAGKLWKLAVSYRNNDYLCTNWPKEVSLTCFKTVSDVHMQYNHISHAKHFAKYSKPPRMTTSDYESSYEWLQLRLAIALPIKTFIVSYDYIHSYATLLVKIIEEILVMLKSRSQMFFQVTALKNFANFSGKHLC